MWFQTGKPSPRYPSSMHDLEHVEIINHIKRYTLPESVNNDDVIHHDDDPWETTDNEYDSNHYENYR